MFPGELATDVGSRICSPSRYLVLCDGNNADGDGDGNNGDGNNGDGDGDDDGIWFPITTAVPPPPAPTPPPLGTETGIGELVRISRQSIPWERYINMV